MATREEARAVWMEAIRVENASLAIRETDPTRADELRASAAALYQQARDLGYDPYRTTMLTEEQALGILPRHWFAD